MSVVIILGFYGYAYLFLYIFIVAFDWKRMLGCLDLRTAQGNADLLTDINFGVPAALYCHPLNVGMKSYVLMYSFVGGVCVRDHSESEGGATKRAPNQESNSWGSRPDAVPRNQMK